ncbi:MAG: hypothetical protein ACRC1T_04755 [Clostridium chrysemydis]|uniref:hypothetical protein n=1 Tax=Clostridium chrysemydis TaxID=2665504 RepID=UPI003F3E7A21
MAEILFSFDFDNNLVIFNDGTTCQINNSTNNFLYRNIEFTLESDVEKDLQHTFNQRFVNITNYDA